MSRFTEEDAFEAVRFLAETAQDTAFKRARRWALEASLRMVKARMMQASGESSIGAQEREAYASKEYEDRLAEIEDAILAENEAMFLRDAKAAQLEAWRTQSANERKL